MIKRSVGLIFTLLLSLPVTALSACAVPPPPSSEEKSLQAAMSSDDLAGCEARGGKLEHRGMFGGEACVIPFADAGRTCTDNSQCLGACIRELGEGERAPLTSVVGRCQKENLPGGCFGEVHAGKVEAFICVD